MPYRAHMFNRAYIISKNHKNVSYISYFNCDKKNHYTNTYTKFF